jgi:hypothetical protein
MIMTLSKSDLEKILTLAPSPNPPADLKARLLTKAPTAVAPAPSVRNRSAWNWLRRWWAALAPAMASAACAVVLTVQQTELNELKRQLKAPLPDATAQGGLISAPATTPPMTVEFSTTEEAEIERLKGLVAQLRSEIEQLEKVRIENGKLRLQLSTPAVSGLSPQEMESLEKASEKALSIQCVNNLKQFGLAVRVWAIDNENRLPPNVVCMSNELSTPKILVCPADRSRKVATDWTGFTPANLSYDYFVTSDFNLAHPARVLSRCPIHGHIGLCDGSVHQEVAKAHPEWLTERNGLMYFERATVTTNILNR